MERSSHLFQQQALILAKTAKTDFGYLINMIGALFCASHFLLGYGSGVQPGGLWQSFPRPGWESWSLAVISEGNHFLLVGSGLAKTAKTDFGYRGVGGAVAVALSRIARLMK